MTPEEHEQILYDEQHYQSFSERRFGLSTSKFLAACGFVLALLFYLGVLIFGNNSLSVLFQLEEYQSFLSDDIENLKTQNAALQKQYFELKELESDPVPIQNGATP
ncbi:MAG TPA: hypothetical protein PLM93_07860 [Sulfuricurvum sp.]|nr:MAG: hypothetical protein B7Y30_08605 [Campylobacterales bacterium 16-40-21]OZA03113.1 MAG: hypothetical protein B7X89_05785 [Sulfuricurvum sp. 17-40-25]HQS67083.1 hypothetical protein [Sulfuricurvum sp.]HQT36739.1 hypothetical protein [Sulfuricurvum sp.]